MSASAAGGGIEQFDEPLEPLNISYQVGENIESSGNYEWVSCFDEVLNALNGIPVDIPSALEVRIYLKLFYFNFKFPASSNHGFYHLYRILDF